MIIKEALKSFYAQYPGTFWQSLENKRLAIELTKWAVDDKVLSFINKICKRYNVIETHPDRVVTICSAMGIETIEQLTGFMEFAKNSSLDLVGVFKYLFPVLTRRHFTNIIDFIELRELIHTTIPETHQVLFGPAQHEKDNVIISDADNLLIPYDKFSYVVETCPSDRFRYIPEQRDCDDFTRIVKGWLSEQRIGNLALGGVHANLFQDMTYKYGHAFLMGICEKPDGERVIRFADGQSDTLIWDYGEEPPFNGVNRMEVTEVLM